MIWFFLIDHHHHHRRWIYNSAFLSPVKFLRKVFASLPKRRYCCWCHHFHKFSPRKSFNFLCSNETQFFSFSSSPRPLRWKISSKIFVCFWFPRLRHGMIANVESHVLRFKDNIFWNFSTYPTGLLDKHQDQFTCLMRWVKGWDRKFEFALPNIIATANLIPTPLSKALTFDNLHYRCE